MTSKINLEGSQITSRSFHSIHIRSFIHLFCKKQLTERNCTIKLENWLKYYNSSNIQLQIKLQVQIGLTVNVNDLLRMLTGKRSIVFNVQVDITQCRQTENQERKTELFIYVAVSYY